MNTPFQYYKQVASHFGGTRNGMVVSWPAAMKNPEVVRQQFHHVADVVPTILDATRIPMPSSVDGVAQKPLDGISFAYTFKQSREAGRRKTQVFEMMQNLGIYYEGWFAGTRPAASPTDITKPVQIDLNSRSWELYHVAKDYSQSRNLAASQPDVLKRMQSLFFDEARKSQILPIHGIGEGRAGKPHLNPGRTTFNYGPGDIRIPEDAAPRILGRSFAVTADVSTGPGRTEGVLVAHGGRFSGYSFYVRDGYPTFVYNASARQKYTVKSAERLSDGSHTIGAAFTIDKPQSGSGGVLEITVDGKVAARGRIERTLVTWISMSEYFDVGQDTLTPVADDYTAGMSQFQGDLKGLKFNLD